MCYPHETTCTHSATTSHQNPSPSSIDISVSEVVMAEMDGIIQLSKFMYIRNSVFILLFQILLLKVTLILHLSSVVKRTFMKWMTTVVKLTRNLIKLYFGCRY